jgi:phosphatidylserine decarboxylase
MKHSGKARKAAFKLILFSLITLVVVWGLIAVGALVAAFAMAVAPFLIFIWVVFALFTLYFFRDPEARPPQAPNVVVSPAHGKIDVIDQAVEPHFMGGECHRISMFLSVVDVHVQNAPVSGKVSFLKYSMGQFLNALRTDCSEHNENVLLGFEATDPAGLRMAVRLVAGVLARRIVPYVLQGEEVRKGERISLIQFGSRADVYLPLSARLKVKVGDRVVGGETVLAEVG